MDRRMSWTDLLNSAVYSNEASMSSIDLASDDSFGINTWTSAEPASGGHTLEENGWVSTLTTNDGSRLRMEDSQSRSNNVPHLENLNCNLINNQVNGNIVHNDSSNHYDSSSRSMNVTENPFNVCTLSRKRKGIDDSNTGGSLSYVHQGQSSSMHHPFSSNQNASTTLRIGPSNVEPSQYPVNGGRGRSNRNRRVRVNPSNRQDQTNNHLPSTQEINSQFGSLNISNLSSTNLAPNMHPFSRNVYPLSINTTPSSRIMNSTTVLNNNSTMHRNIGTGNRFPFSAHVNPSNPVVRGQAIRISNSFGHPRITQQLSSQSISPQFASGQYISIIPPPGSSNSNSSGLNIRRVANLADNIREFSLRDGNGSMTSEVSSGRSQRRRISAEHSQSEPTRGERRVNLEDLLFLNRVVLRRPVESRDRHRDMRLDVDNMSYEELLELEERIGDVNTGLDEGKIMECLKQRVYISLEKNPIDAEPCCICQEMFVEEEDVGRLKCGHDFHTACIKEWLMRKNLCPICKMPGLAQ